MRYYIIIVFLSFFVCGALFEESVENGENITVDGHNYTVFASSNDALVVEGNGLRVVIPLNEIIIKSGLQFTYKGSESTYDEYLKKHNLTSLHSEYDDNLSYKLVIEKYAPAITITKTLSNTKISPKDIINITVTIKNTGDIGITGTYNEPLPTYFKKVGPVYVKREEIREKPTSSMDFEWTGNVGKGETVEITQMIELIGIVSNDELEMNKGLFSYQYLEEGYVIRTDELKVTQVYPLQVDITYDPSNVHIGEEQVLTIVLSNDKEIEIDIELLSIEIPETADILQSDDKLNALTWEGNLENNINFELKIKPTFSGNFTTNVYVESTYKNYKKKKIHSQSTNVEIIEPVLNLLLPSTIESNTESNYSFTISNDGERSFIAFGLNISSDLFDDQKYIFTDVTKISKTYSFKTPWTNEDLDFLVYYDYKYKSEFGESFLYKKNKTIKVKAKTFKPALKISLENFSWDENGKNLTFYFVQNRTNDSIIDMQSIVTIGKYRKYLKFKDGKGIIVLENPNESLITLPYQVQYTHKDNEFFSSGTIELEEPIVVTAGAVMHPNETVDAKDDLNPAVTIGGTLEYKDTSMDYIDESSFKVRLVTVNTTMIIALVVVLLTVFFVVTAVVVSTKHKSHKSHLHKPEETEQLLDKKQVKEIDANEVMDTVPMPGIDLNVLEEFIQAQTKKGTTKDKIRKDLMAVGWLEDVIEVFFR